MTIHMHSDFARSAPFWLRRLGLSSWLLLGIMFATMVLLAALTFLSPLVTPLLVAILLGIVFQPVVTLLTRVGLSRTLAAVVTLLLIVLTTGILITILIRGISSQGPEVYRQLEAGLNRVQARVMELPIANSPEALRAALTDSLRALGQGVLGLVGSTFASLAELLAGTYIALYVLYYMLRDGPQMEEWLARRFSLNYETSTAIVADASQSIRLYFQGTAVTALITSVIVMVPILLLRVPLVGSIFVLYFVTSFIPYVGAYLAGAFAVIIAFGSGGPQVALIILLAVIISNGIIQTAVASWALGTSLSLHPLIVFLVTIASGVMGGLMAMILAVPLTSFVVQTVTRLREEGVLSEKES